MANRYWVGGTGSWDATTTHWAATSGGVSGASVPTSVDDVFFDTLSNATLYTVTLTTAPTCRSVTIGAPLTGAVTIAGSAAWGVYGSFTLAATGVTWTNTSAITFAATTTGFTITTNGVTLGNAITLNGAGGGWTLGFALTTTGAFTVTQGAFATANFNLTTGAFASTGALTRSLTLGSSAISCSSWSALAATNLTLTAGTSTITITTTTFNGGGLTYYNVTRANNGFAIGDAGNTFNALTMSSVTAGGTFLCSFAGNQTIGTLTVNGGNANSRASIQTPSTLAGTQITLTVGTFVTNGTIDFRDINFQGAASPITVSTGGDAGNNTNITLATPKTVYWSLAAGGTWNASTAWATTSGGTPATANYPLPQDTAIIENTGLTSGNTIIFTNNPSLGTVNTSTRTLPMTFGISTNNLVIYGDLNLSSAVTTTVTTGSLTFSGYNKTQTITSAGTTVELSIIINGLSTTFSLADALTLGTTKGVTLTLGTLNLNNKNLTCGVFLSTNTNIRSIAFGTSAIYLTGNAATIWITDSGTNLSYTGSPNVYCTYSGSTGTRQIQGSTSATATETNVFNFFITAGSDTVVIGGARRYRTLDFTGFSGTLTAWATSMGIYGDFVASSAMTIAPTTIPLVFLATLITQKITTNTKTLFFPINANNNLQLQDAVAIDPAYAFTLASGTLDLNAKTLTSGTFSSTGSSVRSIAFNGGTIVTSGATFTVSGTYFSTSGTGTISMTSASSKTFAGGGFSYPTLNQGGAGALVITGANTFRTIANTVAPATITLPASTTTSIAGFDLVGTAGNLITLNSSTSGTQATINNTTGGRIGGDYLSYKDTNATPANTISAGANSTSISNNTGWLTTPVVFGATAESITFADAQGGIRGQFVNTADAITLTDSDVSQIAFAPTVAEPLTLATVESAQAAFKPTNAEAITFTDSQSSQVSFVSAATDAITFTDAQAGVRGQFASVADAITLTNTQTASAAFARQVAEILTLTELISIQSNLVGYTAETVVLSDAQIQRGWIKINDSQNANWAAISNTQTPGWTNIDDNQTPGWSDIDNTQG